MKWNVLALAVATVLAGCSSSYPRPDLSTQERISDEMARVSSTAKTGNKDKATANYNVLMFEISGHIRMAPYPIEFTVQSTVDLENSRIELRPR